MTSVDQSNRFEQLSIRYEPRATDSAAVRELVAETGFFTEEEINVAEELVLDRIERGTRSDYLFLFASDGDRLAGYTCYGRIACTDASYDLYWIAVAPANQRTGLGSYLMRLTEQAIKSIGGSRIYIETSGKEQYIPTQNFYRRCGYFLEATFKDFYRLDDDKLVFVRKID